SVVARGQYDTEHRPRTDKAHNVILMTGVLAVASLTPLLATAQTVTYMPSQGPAGTHIVAKGTLLTSLYGTCSCTTGTPERVELWIDNEEAGNDPLRGHEDHFQLIGMQIGPNPPDVSGYCGPQYLSAGWSLEADIPDY